MSISDCSYYERAVSKLQQLYDKPKNEIPARCILSTRWEKAEEMLNEYLLYLGRLSEDCNCKAISAEEHRAEPIRDAFISGLLSINTRQLLKM